MSSGTAPLPCRSWTGRGSLLHLANGTSDAGLYLPDEEIGRGLGDREGNFRRLSLGGYWDCDPIIGSLSGSGNSTKQIHSHFLRSARVGFQEKKENEKEKNKEVRDFVGVTFSI